MTICGGDDVDAVLTGVLNAAAGDDSAGSARSRAVLAARCLEDEPNANDDTVDEILSRLVAELPANDDRSSAVTAVLGLARSRWAARLHGHLARELRARGERAVPYLGRIWGQAVAESAPKSDAEFGAWQSAQIAALDSPRDDQALRAALTIGNATSQRHPAGWHGAATRLLELIVTDDDLLAGAAAWALARMREDWELSAWYSCDGEISRILIAIDRPDVDAARVVSLVTAAGPRRLSTIEPLVAGASDDDPLVRAATVRLLGQTAREGSLPPLVARLADPEPAVRAAAFGALRSSPGIPALVEHLADPDASVRDAVAEALGGLGDLRAIEPLLATLDDQDMRVRASAMSALGWLGDRRAVEPLLARFDTVDAANWRIVHALGSLGDGRAVEPLLARIDSESDAVR